MAPNSGNSDFEFSYRTRQSAWDFLKNNPDPVRDVLIVGGGIVGAGLARQLAFSGVKDVVLVEKGDFASGTSSASSKLIHAGIRYLEQSWIHLKAGRLAAAWENFVFVAEASNERKILGRMAPGLVKPKIIYLILSKNDQRSTFSVLLGVWVYYLLQIIQGQFFSPPKMVYSKKSIAAKFPDLSPDETKVVFSFWDSETDDARLVIENLQDAHRLGGRILNYVELTSFEQGSDHILVQMKNLESGEASSGKFRLLINASGPWVDQVRTRGNLGKDSPALVDRVAGGHLDVYPAVSPYSYYITAADGRLVFVLRREEDGLVYSRIGTTERTLGTNEPSDRIKASPEEINYLKSVVRKYFPRAALDSANHLRMDEGIRPLTAQATSTAFNKSREHEFVEEGRIYHVIGVKLTDFRRAAGELVKQIDWKKFGIEIKSVKSIRRPLRNHADRLYLEENLEKLVSKTMVIHWLDYIERRKGRWPAFFKKYHPEKLEAELSEIAGHLGWDDGRIEVERSTLKSL